MSTNEITLSALLRTWRATRSNAAINFVRVAVGPSFIFSGVGVSCARARLKEGRSITDGAISLEWAVVAVVEQVLVATNLYLAVARAHDRDRKAGDVAHIDVWQQLAIQVLEAAFDLAGLGVEVFADGETAGPPAWVDNIRLRFERPWSWMAQGGGAIGVIHICDGEARPMSVGDMNGQGTIRVGSAGEKSGRGRGLKAQIDAMIMTLGGRGRRPLAGENDVAQYSGDAQYRGETDC